MPRQNLARLLLIIDRSASMAEDNKWAGVLQGLRTLIEEQRKVPGECRVDLVVFSFEDRLVFSDRDIKELPDDLLEGISPDGRTLLYDTVEKQIDRLGSELLETVESERPEKVFVCVMSDGEKNEGNRNPSRVRAKIQHQTEKYSWVISFDALGSAAEAWSMGVSQDCATSSPATGAGSCDSFSRRSGEISKSRSGPASGPVSAT